MTDLRAVFVDAFIATQERHYGELPTGTFITDKAYRVIFDLAARAGFAAMRKAYLYDPHADYEPQVSIFLSHMAGDK